MTYFSGIGTAEIDWSPGGPRRFRKLPVEIEAMRLTEYNYQAVIAWVGEERAVAGVKDGADLGAPPTAVFISTLEGDMRADVGDWIIKGVKGEFYPCKPDVFVETYEPVTD